MPEQPLTLFQAKHCPHCYHWWDAILDFILRRKPKLDLVAIKAFTEAGLELPTGAFVSLEQNVVTLQQPQSAVLSIKSLFIYTDICCRCGSRMITQMQIAKIPVSFRPNMNSPHDTRGSGLTR